MDCEMLSAVNDIISECDAAGWPVDNVVSRRVASIKASALAIRDHLDGLSHRVTVLESAMQQLADIVQP